MRPSGPSSSLILAVSALASLAVGGCLADVPPPCPAGAEGCGCESTRRCAEGLVCDGGLCAAVACEQPETCASFAASCEDALCVGGRCKIVPALAGSNPEGVVQPEGDCGVLRCDGQGEVEPRESPEDIPASEGPCRVGVCEGPNPAQVAAVRGTACSTDDVPSGFCDGVDGDPKCLICLPGATRCAGDAVETCGESGTWSEAVACVRPTPFCEEGPTPGGDSGTVAACTGVSPGFVVIQPGYFWMGSPLGERGRGPDEDGIRVRLLKSFEMGSTEVTQGAWKRLSSGMNPSASQGCGDTCPVENLTWWSALGYANALSADRGFEPCYDLSEASCTGSWEDGGLVCDAAAVATVLPALRAYQDCEGYRLPTEAEWEYAARAGTVTATWLGDLTGTPDAVDGCEAGQANLEPIAWWACNAGDDGGRTNPALHAVATRAASPWGLHDMLGNVWEWTFDAYLPRSDRFANQADDGSGSRPCGTTEVPCLDPLISEVTGGCPENSRVKCGRVYRGGGYPNTADLVRAATRFAYGPEARFGVLGLRLVRTLR